MFHLQKNQVIDCNMCERVKNTCGSNSLIELRFDLAKNTQRLYFVSLDPKFCLV